MIPRKLQTPAAWQGALRPKGRRAARPPAATGARELIPFNWFTWARPSENQVGPSCVGYGLANWWEFMLLRYVCRDIFKAGDQIDGHAAWKRGREMFWMGNMSGGLWLPQGFKAHVDLGILPPGSRLRNVGTDLYSLADTLLETPAVIAREVTDGWFHPAPNGCIDHAPKPAGEGGHCTCICGVDLNGPDSTPYVWDANTWGIDFAWHGYFCMTWAKHMDLWMDGPYTVDLPDGWQKWRGWEKYVVKGRP